MGDGVGATAVGRGAAVEIDHDLLLVRHLWVGGPSIEEQAILGLRPVAVAALRTGRTETAGLLLGLADRNRRPEAVGPAIADSRKGAPRMGAHHLFPAPVETVRSEAHTSELQSLMRISSSVFGLNTPYHTIRRSS